MNVMTYTLAQIQCCEVYPKSLQNFVLNSYVSSEDTRRALPTFSNQGKKSGVRSLVPSPGLLLSNCAQAEPITGWAVAAIAIAIAMASAIANTVRTVARTDISSTF